jgi:phage gpG-like protein
MQDLIERINELNRFIKEDAPRIVGTEAVKHYKKSFQDEAFTDKSEKDIPWQEVKRRKNPRNKGRAAGSRKILTGEKGELGDSITYETRGMEVAIKSDKVYAEVHNKGLRAGRGKGFQMPKRPFIWVSTILKRRMSLKINKRIRRIMKP